MYIRFLINNVCVLKTYTHMRFARRDRDRDWDRDPDPRHVYARAPDAGKTSDDRMCNTFAHWENRIHVYMVWY